MYILSLIIFLFQTVQILTYNIKINVDSTGDEVFVSNNPISKGKTKEYNFDLDSKQMEIQIKTSDSYFGPLWASLDFTHFKVTTNDLLMWKHGKDNEECSSKN